MGDGEECHNFVELLRSTFGCISVDVFGGACAVDAPKHMQQQMAYPSTERAGTLSDINVSG